MAEDPSKEIFSLAVDTENIHASFKKDESSEVPLLLRSHRTKGPVVVTAEALLEKVIERQSTRGDSVSILVRTKAAPSISFQSQRKNVDPIDIQQGLLVEMISSVKDLK